MPTHYLAIDLGAESGRVMLGTLEDARLALEELHRFPNTPIAADGALTWDIPRLFDEVKAGLRIAAARRLPIAGMSTDSWGVDYMLFDATGARMTPTFHYRDARTARGVGIVRSRLAWDTIFEETGIQFMPLNTIFQLAAETPERLARAAHVVPIADAFNFMLSGVLRVDESNASTTQLYNPRTRQWSRKLQESLGLPGRLFPPVVPCGTRLGPLRPDVMRDTGLPAVEVIASCSHDTAAAVAAVPAENYSSDPGAAAPGTARTLSSETGRAGDRRSEGDTAGPLHAGAAVPTWAYLSSGTWSLLGVELACPVLTETCRELNFTNEIGYGGTVRLLRNIVGLWLVQECRREWAKDGRGLDYPSLTKLATFAPPFVSLINPADPRFVAPGGMPGKIAAFCRETGQPEPSSTGATIRCALESLALLYRRTLRQLEQLLGTRFERLHIVGGGSRNGLLNQLTANAVQLPVLAGPVEATALGNVAVQAVALGLLPSLGAAREIIRTSCHTVTFWPEAAVEWGRQAARFERLPAQA